MANQAVPTPKLPKPIVSIEQVENGYIVSLAGCYDTGWDGEIHKRVFLFMPALLTWLCDYFGPPDPYISTNMNSVSGGTTPI
jgi:hypothetical protein